MRVKEPEGGTGAWFATRSDAELKDILERNSAATPACQIALAELERRKAATSERRQLLWIKATFWTTLILGTAGIAVAWFRA